MSVADERIVDQAVLDQADERTEVAGRPRRPRRPCLLGDALIVMRSNGPPKAAVHGIHGATAVVLLAISALLLVA